MEGPPNQELTSRKESKAPGYKVSKERVTILACANATGEHKLRLTIVGKAKDPMLKECILRAEQQPETTGAHMISLRSLIGISAKKRMSTPKQTKITFSHDKCIVPL